jgi:formylglycine-generating enzyme required for sulfatase activity
VTDRPRAANVWLLAALLTAACGTTQQTLVRIADVEHRTSELQERVEALERELASSAEALEALRATVDALPSGVTIDRSCPEGTLAVGDFCVDQWKASVWSEPACDTSGLQYGAETGDYPASFPVSGDWTAPLYACSLPDVVPAGDITWFQAAQACALSGKSLCTNAQWQVAVAGTPPEVAACALESGAPVATGAYTACVSNWGTQDQVGIRWEWTADWTPGGVSWVTAGDGDSARQTPWPATYGDGLDYTLNWNGQALGEGSMEFGLPSAIIRGGDYNNGTEGGSFALSAARGPSHRAPYIGFRCCAAR